MLYPKALQNYFYFINSNVVYNISTSNDKDECGLHKVKYLTEDKLVAKDDTYYDDTNTLKKATEAGTVQASTGKIDEASNSSIFPNVKVVTNPYKSDGSVDTTTENSYYFWYQYLIKDGDKFTSKFVYNKHGEDDYSDYLEIVKAGINEDIDTMVAKGYTLEAIKSSLPWWVWAKAGDDVVINGKKEIVKTASEIASDFNDAKITTAINEKINEMVLAYANEKLKQHGKKFCGPVDVTTNAIDIDEECSD